MPPRRKALPGTGALHEAPAPHVIVGMAHVVVGALRVAIYLFQTLFSDGASIVSPTSIIMAVLAGGTVLGGLWLADGRRRGAGVALTMDLAHVVGLLMLTAYSSALDLPVNGALAVGVVWVLPRMQVEREAEGRER